MNVQGPVGTEGRSRRPGEGCFERTTIGDRTSLSSLYLYFGHGVHLSNHFRLEFVGEFSQSPTIPIVVFLPVL